MLLPLPEPGQLPPLPPPEQRADVAEIAREARRRRHRTARDVGGRASTARARGSRRCSPRAATTSQLFARRPARRAPRAGGASSTSTREMRDAADDRLLARDRTDAPDANLAVCVGESTRVHIVFAGSPPTLPGARRARRRGRFRSTCRRCGEARRRARMAHVLLARHVTSLPRRARRARAGGLRADAGAALDRARRLLPGGGDAREGVGALARAARARRDFRRRGRSRHRRRRRRGGLLRGTSGRTRSRTSRRAARRCSAGASRSTGSQSGIWEEGQ